MQHGMLASLIIVISSVISSIAVSSCSGTGAGFGSTGPGPIDGTYLITGLKCNGTSTPYLPAGATTETVIIQNLVGSFITSGFADGCVSTEGNVFTYPSSTTFTMQQVNRVCSGASCTAGECTANSTVQSAMTFSYTLIGTTFTITRTSDGNDGCAAGQTTVYSGTKQ